MNKRKYYWPLMFISILLQGCLDQQTMKEVVVEAKQGAFVVNPVEGVNVPVTKSYIMAEKGGVLEYETGSKVVFPQNALLDSMGNIVQGEVEVVFREFLDPVDFFLAGIPMDYDSAGTAYVFESSAMCEIYAYQDGRPLFVNTNAKPQMQLSSGNIDSRHNLYYLDTLKRKWVFQGKDSIVEFEQAPDVAEEVARPEKTKQEQKLLAAIKELPELIPPIKPRIANGQRPVFSIKIESYVNPELKEYDKLKFEVHEEDTAFNKDDYKVVWENVAVKKAQLQGQYWVTFTKGNRQVTYLTHPVFDEEDYEAALAVFEDKMKSYERLKKERLDKEAALKKRLEEERKARLAKIEEMQRKRNQQAAYLSQARRVFNIENFGIWNCDRPLNYQGYSLFAFFRTAKGVVLDFDKLYMAYSEYNSLLRIQGGKVRILPNSENLLWGMQGNKLYYLKDEDIKALELGEKDTSYSFVMKEHADTLITVKDFKQVLNF